MKQKERDEAQRRIDQLTIAIEAIEGKPVNGANGKAAVTDVVIEALNEYAPNEVFDTQAVRGVAVKLRPDMEGRITRGVYSAVNTLVKKGKIKRVPNGFMLA